MMQMDRVVGVAVVAAIVASGGVAIAIVVVVVVIAEVVRARTSGTGRAGRRLQWRKWLGNKWHDARAAGDGQSQAASGVPALGWLARPSERLIRTQSPHSRRSQRNT
jgi:hypothetical protein